MHGAAVDHEEMKISKSPGNGGLVRTALEPLRGAMATVLGRYPDGERGAITDFLSRATETMPAETDRLRALARGGFINDVYAAPVGGAAHGRLIFHTRAPRGSLNATPLRPATRR